MIDFIYLAALVIMTLTCIFTSLGVLMKKIKIQYPGVIVGLLFAAMYIGIYLIILKIKAM